MLETLGKTVADHGNLTVGKEGTEPNGLRNFLPALQVYVALKQRVAESISRKALPLMLGGDHSNSIGSVSAALEAYGDDLAVIWIDAHADVNTPRTSPSGNLHGMPMAALLGMSSGVHGLPDLQWQDVLDKVVPKKRLQSEKAAWFGLRDVDGGERTHYAMLAGEYTATMYDIDRYGIIECLKRFDSWLRNSGAQKLWISFDVDSLDPNLAPGTGTAVRGGLTYREMHLMGEFLSELLDAPDCPYSLAGLDVVEINPIFDNNNATARTAVEWIGSLFGKTILGKR